ncbi:MAG: carboxypeptidase-like regulatory domain-containing protein [Pyrinomonadaceae bacterium]|nr:carboxypeptidase-like regulatory domain-containing protein [Pyrinomonadaceae bacterium]
MKKFIFVTCAIALFSFISYSQNGGIVKGKVRNSKGAGISDVTVTVKQKEEDVQSVKTDSKGNFSFNNLKDGVYNFIFEKEGFNRGTLYNIEVKKNKPIDLGDRLVLGIDQGTLVIVKGSVFDQDGRSLPGAKVDIFKVLDGSTKKMNSGFSSYFGEFTFRFAEEKTTYRVTASAKGFETASKDVSVEFAGIYRLAISLKKKED